MNVAELGNTRRFQLTPGRLEKPVIPAYEGIQGCCFFWVPA
jgi:hypothetical protein